MIDTHEVNKSLEALVGCRVVGHNRKRCMRPADVSLLFKELDVMKLKHLQKYTFFYFLLSVSLGNKTVLFAFNKNKSCF